MTSRPRVPGNRLPRILLTLDNQAWDTIIADVKVVARRAARAAYRIGSKDVIDVRDATGPVEFGLTLAGDEQVRILNRDWRGKDRPTNVLSFAALDEDGAGPAPPGQPLLLGDIVLAFETCDREARAQDKALVDHFQHLVVHGVLHLLGFDHESEAEAEDMEKLEIAVLAGLGVADPYVQKEERYRP